ncbi:MAG: hypothetical protein Q8K30_03920 [Candidatus Gracilibacteria bacterium]|nr:hypothetical protein [Candidatus Gracilibacteria bacterium]
MKNKTNKSHQKESISSKNYLVSEDVDIQHELFMKRLIEILG